MRLGRNARPPAALVRRPAGEARRRYASPGERSLRASAARRRGDALRRDASRPPSTVEHAEQELVDERPGHQRGCCSDLVPGGSASSAGWFWCCTPMRRNGILFGEGNEGRHLLLNRPFCTIAKAWKFCDPDAENVFKALRKAGVKTAVVSNFDTRLRPLLQVLKCDHWFDAVAVSAEVAAEKPNPTIFLKACELLGVKPEEAVHVGDDRRNDIWGARDAGCDAWLWGSDVHSFKEVAERIGREDDVHRDSNEVTHPCCCRGVAVVLL